MESVTETLKRCKLFLFVKNIEYNKKNDSSVSKIYMNNTSSYCIMPFLRSCGMTSKCIVLGVGDAGVDGDGDGGGDGGGRERGGRCAGEDGGDGVGGRCVR